MDYRLEQDVLGEKNIDNSTYSGINTARALENFDLNSKSVNLNLIREIALIKKAAAMTNKTLKFLDPEKADAIIKASEEVIDGKFDDEFKLSAFQGGAGTSTNMNVNEVISNRAIEILNGEISFTSKLYEGTTFNVKIPNHQKYKILSQNRKNGRRRRRIEKAQKPRQIVRS